MKIPSELNVRCFRICLKYFNRLFHFEGPHLSLYVHLHNKSKNTCLFH